MILAEIQKHRICGGFQDTWGRSCWGYVWTFAHFRETKYLWGRFVHWYTKIHEGYIGVDAHVVGIMVRLDGGHDRGWTSRPRWPESWLVLGSTGLNCWYWAVLAWNWPAVISSVLILTQSAQMQCLYILTWNQDSAPMLPISCFIDCKEGFSWKTVQSSTGGVI